MTLIIQDDTGTVENANSLVTGAYYVSYMADRGVTISYTEPEDIIAVDADLIQANSYMDTLNKYCGTKVDGRDQTTQFPRLELYDCEGYLVEGIPREMQHAQCEYANIHRENGTLQPNESTGGGIKREKKKVDVIEKEIEYFSEGQSGAVIAYPVADNKIPQSFICQSCTSNEDLINY